MASGGNLSYTYLWDNGDTRATADTLGFGLHSVTVTDIKGCTKTCTVLIEEPAELTCMASKMYTTSGELTVWQVRIKT